MINDLFRIQINDVAKFKMDVSVKVPIPRSVNDITQIENIIPIPSLGLERCYNKISNNLPDVKEVNDLDDLVKVDNKYGEIINDPNKAINQEDVYRKLFST